MLKRCCGKRDISIDMRRAKKKLCEFKGPNCHGEFWGYPPNKKYCDACAYDSAKKREYDRYHKNITKSRNRKRLMTAFRNR